MPNCTICNTPSPFLLKKDGYDQYRCPKCELVFVHPQPAENYLAEEVYSVKSGYQSNKSKDLSALVPTEKQEKILAYLETQLKGRLLDIGCSSGEFMYLAQKHDEEVFGVELNPRTAEMAKANGLKVTVGTVESAKFSSGTYDFVYMGDLIEHVKDPNTLIAETVRLLKTKGQIIIVTPNMDCFWSKSTLRLWRWFKIPWASATPPHHLYQFSYGNLRSLLEKHKFIAEYAWYTKTPSLKYELGSLHLLKLWKNERTFASLAFMIFSFAVYTIVFGLNRVVELFPAKRFAMTMVASKS